MFRDFVGGESHIYQQLAATPDPEIGFRVVIECPE
jgi:hypothetical protein